MVLFTRSANCIFHPVSTLRLQFKTFHLWMGTVCNCCYHIDESILFLLVSSIDAPLRHNSYYTTGLPHQVPMINRSLPGPLPNAQPLDVKPHCKRCLRGKVDFTGSAQFLVNTVFTAEAGIGVAASVWQRVPLSGLPPHTTPELPFAPTAPTARSPACLPVLFPFFAGNGPCLPQLAHL